MLAKTSITFLLNPVVDGASDFPLDVDQALNVLESHRKRPSIAGVKRARTMAQAISPSKKAALVCSSCPSIAKAELSFSPRLSGSSDGTDSDTPTEAIVKPRRKRIRIRKPTPCTTPGCDKYAVTKGSCVRHGGGARCEHPGCEKRAKKNKRCFTHGGCSQCQHDGCTSKAKRYGYCWAHGGGITCSVDGCDKVGAQGGCCWAHGGGSRCKIDRCTRRAYQKDGYLCAFHTKHNNV